MRIASQWKSKHKRSAARGGCRFARSFCGHGHDLNPAKLIANLARVVAIARQVCGKPTYSHADGFAATRPEFPLSTLESEETLIDMSLPFDIFE